MLDKTLHDFKQVPCVLNSHNGDGIIYRKKIYIHAYTHTRIYSIYQTSSQNVSNYLLFFS